MYLFLIICGNNQKFTMKLHDAYEHLTLHDKMQKEFIELVAHELRTPITPIIGLTEHVRDKLNDNNK